MSNISERWKNIRSGKKEEEQKSSSTSIQERWQSIRASSSAKEEKHGGLWTSSDISARRNSPERIANDYANTLGDIESAYSSWQDASTMTGLKTRVNSVADRLNAYNAMADAADNNKQIKKGKTLDSNLALSKNAKNDIVNQAVDSDIRSRNKSKSIANNYSKQADNVGKLADYYSQFESADEFNTTQKYGGKKLTFEEVQKALEDDSISDYERNYLENYGINGLYTNLSDYDKEIEARKKNPAKEEPVSTTESPELEALKNNPDRYLEYTELKNAQDNATTNTKSQTDLDKLKAARNRYALDNKFDYYKGYLNAPDIEAKGVYDSSVGNLAYQYINGGEDAAKKYISTLGLDNSSAVTENAKAQSYENYAKYLTEDEKKVYSYLATTDPAKADKFLKDMRITVDKRMTEADALNAQTIVNNSNAVEDIIGSMGTVLPSIAGGIISGIANIGDRLMGNEVNPYQPASRLSNFMDSYRQAVSDKIEQNSSSTWSFLYNTGMSMLDSLTGAGIATLSEGTQLATLGRNLYGASMGLGAGSQRIKELKDQGASDEQAFIGGALSGIAEGFFEEYSLEKLISIKDVDSKLELLKNFLRQSFTEGSEEVFTEIANMIIDEINRGDLSDYHQKIDSYMAQGMSESEAKAQAIKDSAMNVALAGLGGAISGGVMGGVKSTFDYASNKSTGKSAKGLVSDSRLVEAGKNLPEDNEFYKKAQKYNADKLTNAQRGSLLNNVGRETVSASMNVLNDENATEESRINAVTNMLNLNRVAKSESERSADEGSKGIAVGENSFNGRVINTFVKDGENYIKTSDGTEIKFSDATMTQAYKDVVGYASQIDNMTERMEFLSNYDGKTDLNSYTNAFDYVYQSGVLGLNKSKLSTSTFSQEQIDEIYASGRELNQQLRDAEEKSYTEAVKAAQKPLTALLKTFNPNNTYATGTFDTSDTDGIKLNEEQTVALDALKQIYEAASLPVNIKTFASKTDAEGNFNAEQGWYDEATNTIHVDVYAGYKNLSEGSTQMVQVMSHELTHWAESKAPTTFKALSDNVIDSLAAERGVTRDNVIANEIAHLKEVYKNAGIDKEVTRELAISEITARACEDMLKDKKVFDKYTKNMSQNQKRTFVEKVKDLLGKLADLFKSLAERFDTKSSEYKEFARQAKAYDRARAQWASMLEQASRVGQAENGNNSVKKDGTKFDVRELNKELNLIAVHNLYEDNLLDSIKLGGFPAPSIAITKANMEHSNFGDISIVFGKDTIDPKKNIKNNVYSSDAYTPTFPRIDYEANSEVNERISDLYYSLYGTWGEIVRPLYSYVSDLAGELDKRGGEIGIINNLKNDTAMMQVFNIATKSKPIESITHTTTFRLSESQINIAKKVINEFEIVNEPGVENNKGILSPGFVRNNEQKLREIAYEVFLEDMSKKDAREVSDSITFKELAAFLQKPTKSYLVNGEEYSTTEVDYSATREKIAKETDSDAYVMWLQGLFKGAEKSKGIRNDKDTFTPSGRRRTFKETHYPVNLTNIVKVMSSGESTGIAAFGSSIYGASSQKYNSISDIKDNSSRLTIIGDDEFSNLKKLSQSKFSDIASRLVKHTQGLWDCESMLAEAVSRYGTDKSRLTTYIKKEGSGWTNFSPSIVDDLVDVVNEIRTMPTGYFEAKPMRAVGLDEIKMAVIPNTSSKELVSLLDSNHIPYREYENGNNKERLTIIRSLDGVRFSLRDSQGNNLSEQQAEYFKDSKVRDEDGNLIVMYHGTPNANFTVFDSTKGSSSFGRYKFGNTNVNYFTTESNNAKSFMISGDTGKLYTCYLNVKNPYSIDARNESSFGIASKELREYQSNLFDMVVDSARAKANNDVSLEEINNEMMIIGLRLVENKGYIDVVRMGRNNAFGSDDTITYGSDVFDALTELLDEKEYVVGQESDSFSTDEIVQTILGMNKYYGYDYDGVVINNVFDSASIFNTTVGTDVITFSSNQIKSVDNENPTENDDIRYSVRVTDKDTLDFLNKQIERGEYYTTYKSMSFWGYDENGNAILRSPMAEYVDGKLSDAYLLRSDGKFDWYKSTEDIDEETGIPRGLLAEIDKKDKDKYPSEDIETSGDRVFVKAYKHKDVITDDWSNCYFMLNKKVEDGVKKNGEPRYKNSPVPARYAPYEHSSNLMLNDQFESAWRRANLVTVKMYVPYSEANGASRTKYAKDSTGWTEWHSGIVASNIRKQKPSFDRQVFLSNYAMPVEIVSDTEVAKAYKEYVSGTDIQIPDNVVSPSLLEALKKADVPIKVTGKVKFKATNDFGIYERNQPMYSTRSDVELGTLFSGADTFAYALDGLIHTQYAAENRPEIVSVYKQNHGGVVFEDVLDIDINKMPNVQHLHVSPPCVNFSNMNNTQGEKPIDIDLARKVADIIKTKKPRALTLENVAGYANSNSMRIIMNALKEVGYKGIDIDTYKDSEYGGYTNRERVILRAMRDEELPAVRGKVDKAKGWGEAVGMDYLNSLTTAKKVNPRMIKSLKELSGIDVRKITKPLLVFGESYKNKTFGHAYYDETLPTIIAESGASRVFMPGGEVKEATPDLLAKIMGIDGFKLPKSKVTARRVIGNGIPAAITTNVMSPVIERIKADNEERVSRGEDIQYSLRQQDVLADITSNKERLRSQNAALQTDAENLAKRLELATFSKVKAEDIQKYVEKFVTNANLDIDASKVAKRIATIFNNNLNVNDISRGTFQNAVENYAVNLADAIKGAKQTDYKYAKLINTLRTTTIQMSDTQYEDAVRYAGGESNLSRMTFGKMKISTTEGTDLDEFYDGLVKTYPELFSQTSDADKFATLIGAYNDVMDARRIVTSYRDVEATKYLQSEIYNIAWQILGGGKEAEALRLAHSKSMDAMRQTYRAGIDDKSSYAQVVDYFRRETKRKTEVAREYGLKRLERYKDTQARNAEIKKITSKASELMKSLKTDSKDNHVPKVLKTYVANFLESLDFSSKRKISTGEFTQRDEMLSARFSDLSRFLKDAKTDSSKIAEELNGYLDIPEEYLEELDEVSKALADIEKKYGGDTSYVLNQLALDDLKTIRRDIIMLGKVIKTTNNFIANARFRQVSDAAREDISYFNEFAHKRDKNNKVEKLIHWQNTLPYYAFQRFGEGGQAIFESLMDGWDNYAFRIRDILDAKRAIVSDETAGKWAKEVHEITLENGDTIKMTSAQIMSFYCLNRRELRLQELYGEKAPNHLRGGGIHIGDFKLKGKTYVQSETHSLSMIDIANIASKLSDEQRVAAEKLQEFMTTTCSKWGNETSMKRYGIESFTEDMYFPIKVDPNNIASEPSDKENNLFRLLNLGFTKALTKGANNSIMVNDIFDVFSAHSTDMAKYNSLALPVLDAFKWFSFKEKIGDGKAITLKSALDTAFGDDAKGYIYNFLKDINGAQDGGRDEEIGNIFTKYYKVAAVAFNLRVALLQPTAYLRASAVLSASDMAAGFRKPSSSEKAKKYSGIAYWKDLGFFTIDTQRNVQNIIKGEKNIRDKVADAGLWLAGKGDELTWGHIWNACEHNVLKNNPYVTKDSDGFNQLVAKKFREVIYKSQVVDSTMTRTEIMRSKSSLAKLLTAFMSEPSISWNLFSNAVHSFTDEALRSNKSEAWKKTKGIICKSAYAYLITAVGNALAEALIDAFRDIDDFDDDKTWAENFGDKYGDNFWANLVDDMSLLAKLPYIKEAYSVFKFGDMAKWYSEAKRNGEVTGADVKKKWLSMISITYSSSRMDMAVIDSVRKSFVAISKTIANDDKSIDYKTVYTTAQAISHMTGMPLSPLVREFSKLWNNVMFAIGYDSMTIE